MVSRWTRTAVSQVRVLELYVVVRTKILSSAALKLIVTVQQQVSTIKKRLTFTNWHMIGPFVQHTSPGVIPAHHLIPAMNSTDKAYHSKMKTPSIRDTDIAFCVFTIQPTIQKQSHNVNANLPHLVFKSCV